MIALDSTSAVEVLAQSIELFRPELLKIIIAWVLFSGVFHKTSAMPRKTPTWQIAIPILLVFVATELGEAQSFIPDDMVLLAHYPLTVSPDDTTGNNDPITLSNVEFTAEGAFFNGVYNGNDPDGSDARTPQFPDLDLDAFAISARFEAQEAFDGPVFVLGSLWRSAGVWLSPDSMISGYTNGTADTRLTGPKYTPGVFHNAGIVYDGEVDTLYVYLDDVLIQTVGRELSHGDDRDVTVTDGGLGRTFHGVLNDLRIFSRESAPTASEATSLPDSPFEVGMSVYPNPITPSSQPILLLQSASEALVEIDIRDILGRQVRRVIQSKPLPGAMMRYPLDLNLVPGLYVAVARQDGMVTSTSFIVTRTPREP